jgi:hypothetical protein
VDLPTYTSIWRIEKRLYKLYDFRLPMPLPIGQIAVFTAIAVPYVVLLTVLGLPFNHKLIWLYVLPPGLLTWLATRPVLESKRLPELVMSQLRYLAEPRVWCRMAPLAEKDVIVVTGRVWRRHSSSSAPAAELEPAASARLQLPSWPTGRHRSRPVVAAAVSTASAAAVPPVGSLAARLAAPAAARAASPAAARPASPVSVRAASPAAARPASPVAARAASPVAARAASPAAARPALPAVARPASPAPSTPARVAAPAVSWSPGRPVARLAAPAASDPADRSWPGSAPAAASGPGSPSVRGLASPAPAGPTAARPAMVDPAMVDPDPDPPPAGTAAGKVQQTGAPPRRPVVTVLNEGSAQATPPAVERALAGPSIQRGETRPGRVLVVPGGHRPGKPNQLQRDRIRAQLPISRPSRIVVLGCTVGAGQTVTALLTGEVLAGLRADQVAVIDLNPGNASLTQRARSRPALSQAASLGSSRLEVLGQPWTASDDQEGTAGAFGSATGPAEAARTFELASARFPLVLADPSTSAVPRLLAIADQLVLVAPASAAAAGAIAMTFEWLEAHGQAGLAARAIMVLNGVSRRTVPHVEQAERVAAGRCRAIVRVPWDDQLQNPAAKRPHPAAPGSTAGQHWVGVLSPATVGAYTALAGVLVAALADDPSPRSGPAAR